MLNLPGIQLWAKKIMYKIIQTIPCIQNKIYFKYKTKKPLKIVEFWIDLMYCAMFSRSACLTLCDSMDCSLLGSCLHGDSPHKNTEVSCHAHLQGIFPTQGSNPGLLHHRLILYCLSHQGSPNRSNTDHKFILENSNNTLISEALLRNLLIKHLS